MIMQSTRLFSQRMSFLLLRKSAPVILGRPLVFQKTLVAPRRALMSSSKPKRYSSPAPSKAEEASEARWAMGVFGILLAANAFVIWAELNDDSVDSFIRSFGVGHNKKSEWKCPEEELELSHHLATISKKPPKTQTSLNNKIQTQVFSDQRSNPRSMFQGKTNFDSSM